MKHTLLNVYRYQNSLGKWCVFNIFNTKHHYSPPLMGYCMKTFFALQIGWVNNPTKNFEYYSSKPIYVPEKYYSRGFKFKKLHIDFGNNFTMFDK